MSKPIKNPGRMATVMALTRVDQALGAAQADPKTSDGVVTLQVDDLAALVMDYREVRDAIALGRRQWINMWRGSGDDRGASIWTVNAHGGHGVMVAHFGDAKGVHEAVCKIVLLHNARLVTAADA